MISSDLTNNKTQVGGIVQGWQAAGFFLGCLADRRDENATPLVASKKKGKDGEESDLYTQPDHLKGPQLIVNINLYESMKQWFDFHFPTATITYSLSSVMEHLCKIGLPIEYIEEQFYYNSMAN